MSFSRLFPSICHIVSLGIEYGDIVVILFTPPHLSKSRTLSHTLTLYADIITCISNTHPALHTPPTLDPTLLTPTSLHPTIHTPPTLHSTLHTPPTLHPTLHTPPTLHPTLHTPPTLHPTLRTPPILDPTLHTPPTLHPSHTSNTRPYPHPTTGLGLFEPWSLQGDRCGLRQGKYTVAPS